MRLDFSQIKRYPIKERKNKFAIANMIPLNRCHTFENRDFQKVCEAVVTAYRNNKTTIFMLGGAVVKEGCSLALIEMMKQGGVSHLAVNGAVSIHDFEIALIGESSEDVQNGLQDGTFGMVEETGMMMNEALKSGAAVGKGYGESIGSYIIDNNLPFKEYSLFYWAMKLNIPISVHIAIGGDIIHQHPTCDGAVLGATSFKDFKILTDSVGTLREGVLLNIGSAVNLPEVFLKGLTIARNLSYPVENFTTANFDFLDMYRPRTRLVQWPQVIGCTGYDIRGSHRETIPGLYRYFIDNFSEGS